MDLGLEDKVALVAGGSRGIGFAIARAFLSEGACVAIAARDGEQLERARGELGAAERVLAIQADMTRPSGIESALAKTTARFGGIDAAVANVGSGVARSGFELSREDWQGSLEQNLLGSVVCASAVLPHLIARRGSFTFISSIAGCEALGAPVTYGASKAALQSAMKSFSRLVGAQGVRVNAVAPGNVLFPGGVWEAKLAERRELIEQYVRSEVPLQRFGTPEEIAQAVVFVASARASFVTGACLVVDGGQTRSFF